MPLGSLINKLLRGEADEWCETDLGFYLESLTHGDKKELEQVLETVDAVSYTHLHDKSEEHCQWDDGCDNQSGTEVAEEEDEYKEDDNRSFNQVVDNRRDCLLYTSRCV